MAARTALMEWLEQTKRISKEEDYMGLAIIDEVMKHVHAVQPDVILKYKDFFNRLCAQYHKPNPIKFLTSRNRDKQFRQVHKMSFHKWQSSFCRYPKGYPKGGCKAFKFFQHACTEQLEIQIQRFLKAQDVIKQQWWEVIDFMYERPELVNPALIDDYITTKITDVCSDGKKNNPLTNGIKIRFGKFWRDKDGKWHPEKRQRF